MNKMQNAHHLQVQPYDYQDDLNDAIPNVYEADGW